MGEPFRTTPLTGGNAEPVPFTTNKMDQNLMGTAAVQQFAEVKEIVTPPVVSTTTVPTMGTGVGTGMATPCHPVTGATGPYPKAAPIGNTTTAYPGTTTFEQTSGIPTSTHMYGVPLATYQKGPQGVMPVTTPGMGTMGTTGAPMTQTFFQTTPGVTPGLSSFTPGLASDVARTTTTHVTDSYTPIGVPSTTTGPKGVVSATPIPDNMGVHHHDRAHHHHVHDRLPVTGGVGSGMSSTTVPAPTVSGATATGGVGSGASTAKAKALGDKEHQIIQDVIPPGRNRVVEHHEKY